MNSWRIYEGAGTPDPTKYRNRIPAAPPWRQFNAQRLAANAVAPATAQHFFQVDAEEIKMVNAALYLRRPLLVTGLPGTGKSTLARAVAYELGLGEVLVWPITSRASLKEALYRYDALGRLQKWQFAMPAESPGASPMGALAAEKSLPAIGDFITLGPLGTAFADSAELPRVLLIDEIDKSDIDLPNDLLHIFEEGRFEIPELAREQEGKIAVRTHNSDRKVEVARGQVVCRHFPFIVLTSNGERELPGPFMRRCLQLTMEPPDAQKMARIVAAHFNELPAATQAQLNQLIQELDERRQRNEHVAVDQLLNAVYMTINRSDTGTPLSPADLATLRNDILRTIGEANG